MTTFRYKVRSTKEVIDKLDFIRNDNFCSVKNRLGEIFAKGTFDKGLLSKIKNS